MRQYFNFLLFTCLLLQSTLPAIADEDIQCPETLAIVQNDRVVDATVSKLTELYLKLGCSPILQEFPGRRGILHFNERLVDGEFFRIPQVEYKYSRPFVRSAVPLFQTTNRLWLHPDPKVRDSLPIGYIRGVVWHEEYMKDRQGVAFSNGRKMFSFYQKGRISGFLASTSPAVDHSEISRLHPAPVRGELISKLSLYHYLGSEHAVFMKKLSELLEANNPFEKTSTP